MQFLTILSIAFGNALMASAQDSCKTSFYSETGCKGNEVTVIESGCDYMGEYCHNVNTSARIQSFKTTIPEENANVIFYSGLNCNGTIVADGVTGCVSLSSNETVLSFIVSL